METTTEIKDLKLTELESKFIEVFIGLLYAEPGFTDVDVMDMSKHMCVSVNTAKGVLGSLCKKGIVYAQEVRSNRQTIELISLHTDYYYLHPIWKNA